MSELLNFPPDTSWVDQNLTRNPLQSTVPAVPDATNPEHYATPNPEPVKPHAKLDLFHLGLFAVLIYFLYTEVFK